MQVPICITNKDTKIYSPIESHYRKGVMLYPIERGANYKHLDYMKTLQLIEREGVKEGGIE
jgi:hypothetical protein